LPEDALSWTDNFPLPPAAVADAVAAFGKSTEPQQAGRPLAVLLTHRRTATPMLQAAFEKSQGEAKRLYARVLATFGDRRVVPFLIGELDKVEAWDRKVLQGRMADYAHLPTPVDSLVLALGYAGDRAATGALQRMIGMLRDGNGAITLSHYRAVAVAAERLGDPALAEPLASLLSGKDGWRGGSAIVDPTLPETGRRSRCFREICLARALYRIGDHDGLGRKVLETYLKDKRGLFARHAAAVLAEEPGSCAGRPAAAGGS
jgi:hypothetical protein